MMPVEVLREAAKVLREMAGRAPEGPWSVEYFGDAGYPQRITNAQATVIAMTYEGGVGLRPIPEYIRLMNPLVGVALAELLEHLADEMADGKAEERDLVGGREVVDLDQPTWGRREWTAALALARLVLGGEPT